MDSKKLEIFITVAELGNISAAAEKLHISHQGVSQQIKGLETEIGALLFERSNNRITITDIGQKMYDIFKPVVDGFNAGSAELNSYITAQKASISIAYFSGIGYAKTIMPIVDMLRETSPDADITLVSGEIKKCISKVRNNHVDAAIVPIQLGEQQDGLNQYLLKRVPMNILVSQKHEWATKKSVTREDISHGKMLVYDNRSEKDAPPFMSSIEVEEQIFVDNFDNYMLRLAKGDVFGINFEDYSTREWNVELLELPECYKIDMDIVLVCKAGNIHADAFRRTFGKK